jgi:hypothetical protein
VAKMMRPSSLPTPSIRLRTPLMVTRPTVVGTTTSRPPRLLAIITGAGSSSFTSASREGNAQSMSSMRRIDPRGTAAASR